MKRIILFLAVCLISTTVWADIVTLRTDETQRYDKWNEATNVYEVYQTFHFVDGQFVNIETNKADNDIRSFTGRYTVFKSEKVYDDVKGNGTMFYLKKGNVVYALAVYDEYMIMSCSDDNNQFIYTFYF